MANDKHISYQPVPYHWAVNMEQIDYSDTCRSVYVETDQGIELITGNKLDSHGDERFRRQRGQATGQSYVLAPTYREAIAWLQARTERLHTLWMLRAIDYINEDPAEHGYLCSWWLRLEYQEIDQNPQTTAQINYYLRKAVDRGIFTKTTTRSYTKFTLNK